MAVIGGRLDRDGDRRGRPRSRHEVTVVDPQPVPLRGVLGDEIGEVFAELHRDHGVDLRLGTRVAALTGSDGAASRVRPRRR